MVTAVKSLESYYNDLDWSHIACDFWRDDQARRMHDSSLDTCKRW
jgi:hypothetical protein